MAYDIGPFDGGNLGAKRLLALAGHLETVRDADYDHHFWRRQRSDGSCVMCALGHGVDALPDVIGLRWGRAGEGDIVRLDGSGVTENTIALAAEVFGLSIDDATIMFGMGPCTAAFYGASRIEDIKPRAVATAIRRFALARMTVAA
jgi:hypothetical protein